MVQEDTAMQNAIYGDKYYCPTCRTNHWPADGTAGSNSPYSVIHRSRTEHLHPITRQPLR